MDDLNEDELKPLENQREEYLCKLRDYLSESFLAAVKQFYNNRTPITVRQREDLNPFKEAAKTSSKALSGSIDKEVESYYADR